MVQKGPKGSKKGPPNGVTVHGVGLVLHRADGGVLTQVLGGQHRVDGLEPQRTGATDGEGSNEPPGLAATEAQLRWT